MKKVTKKELVKAVYDQLLADLASGFRPIPFNLDGSLDTNRFIRRAQQSILAAHNIDVKSETCAVYLREFKRSA